MNRLLLIVLAVCFACPVAHGQTARYRGRIYTPESFSRATWCPCPMCQSIRAQWARTTPTAVVTPRTVTKTRTVTPRTVTPVVQPTQTTYRTETRYRTETYQVKHCNGRTCYYTTEMRSVPYTVRVAVPAPVVVKPEPKAATSFDPTPHEVVRDMVNALRLTSSDYFIDIGCGDGRIVVEAADSGATLVGIEIDEGIAGIARKSIASAGVSATIKVGDATEFAYGNATAVSMYLYPDLMAELVPKLKPGTRIVSYAHEIPGLSNASITRGSHTIYTATVPVRRSLFGLLVDSPEIQVSHEAPAMFGL